MLSVLVAVDLVALVILNMVILCTFASLSATPFDSLCFLFDPSVYISLSYTSTLYVNFRIATVTYSCCMSFADILFDNFKRQQSCRIYSVPLTMVSPI